MDELAALRVVLTSVGLGLLMGLERERREGAIAGLRTFALVSLAGAISGLLAREAGLNWLVPAVALGLVVMAVVADRGRARPHEGPDTTTTVALLLCFLFGVMLAYGYLQLTAALALGTTALLYFKTELHGATRALTRQDIVSFLQFAAITFVVLPVLPDKGYGPYHRLNPYEIWLMVVLTAGLSLAGYAALRLAPRGQAMPLLGTLGGLVSSTATTLVFARHARKESTQVPVAVAIILIANLVLLVRVGVLTAVLAPRTLATVAPMLALGLAGGVACSLREWLRLARAQGPKLELENPAKLRHALAFGAVYAVVLVVSAAVHERAGSAGVYAVAAFSGVADMDAIAISTLQMFKNDQLGAAELCRALVIALGANMAFKNLAVLVLGGRAAALRVAANYAMTYAGLLAGALLLA
jgi:uncharacterized membrane protein (DUF4010 family)